MNEVKEAFPGFKKPSIAIDTVLLRVKDNQESSNRKVSGKQLQVLLITEKETYRTKREWHLPGTILRLGETPTDAINRIIVNKTRLQDVYYEQLYTVADDVFRDDRGHIVSIVYIGIVDGNEEIVLPEDSKYIAQWAWIEKEDSIGRGFAIENGDTYTHTLKYDHAKIISDTINRLKGKLMYTDIGFRFIGKTFTIKELENTFEAVNERNIPGFRRIIGNKVVGTGIMSDGKAFRPAELFTKKE